MSDAFYYSTVDLKSELLDVLAAKLVPMVRSRPGEGKSAIIHQIAAENNLKVIDIRLGQCDPTDLNGFPQIVNGKATYVPMDTFPLEGDPLPLLDETDPSKGTYNGWLLFFDELPTAPVALQACAYKILLERLVGNKKLHKKVAMVAAGNREEDNAGAQEMLTALQSRLVHFTLQTSASDWIDYARAQKLDTRIISFIQYRPALLNNFDPDHSDHTFSCPRTWEFLSRQIKALPDIPGTKLGTIVGTIGPGSANEFYTFCQIYRDLVTLPDILNAPSAAKVPSEPSACYAVIEMLFGSFNPTTVAPIMEYVNRLPMEFQVMLVRDIVRASPTNMGFPAMASWMATNASRLTI